MTLFSFLSSPRVPFRSCWTFAGLSFLALATLLSAPCGDRALGAFFAGLLLACTVLSSVIASQKSIASTGKLTRTLGCILALTYDGLALFLVSLIVAVFLPAYSCYDQRSRVAETLTSLQPMKLSVSARVALGVDVLPIDTEYPDDLPNVLWINVNSAGIIDMLMAEPAAFIRLTPRKTEATVDWECMGVPRKIMPANCRH